MYNKLLSLECIPVYENAADSGQISYEKLYKTIDA